MATPKDDVIAIDGPAGVGKSSVAKAVAQELDISMLDTGAIYRAVGVAVFSAGLNPNSVEDCATVLPDCDLRVGGWGEMWLYGESIPQFLLRGAMGSKASSQVAQHPVVRDFLLDMQRSALSELGELVVEGRDIGTVVFPNAMCKIYLTADESVRKARIIHKQLEMGKSQSEAENAAADVTARDARDTERKVAPLRPADDAIIIDTSAMSQSEVVDQITEAYENLRAHFMA